MRYAWTSFRGFPLTLLALVLGPLTVVSRDLSVLLPSLAVGQPFGAVPLPAIAPLVLIILVGAAQAQGAPQTTAVSVRPFGLLPTLLLALSIASYLASYSLTCLLIEQPLEPSALRNAFGYAALLVVGRMMTSAHIAPFIAPLYVFVSTVFGRAPDGSAQPWAWPTTQGSFAEVYVALTIYMLLSGIENLRALGRPPR